MFKKIAKIAKTDEETVIMTSLFAAAATAAAAAVTAVGVVAVKVAAK